MPKQPMKLALVIAITLYATIGASFGAALCAVMPAVNFWGGAYVALFDSPILSKLGLSQAEGGGA